MDISNQENTKRPANSTRSQSTSRAEQNTANQQSNVHLNKDHDETGTGMEARLMIGLKALENKIDQMNKTTDSLKAELSGRIDQLQSALEGNKKNCK